MGYEGRCHQMTGVGFCVVHLFIQSLVTSSATVSLASTLPGNAGREFSGPKRNQETPDAPRRPGSSFSLPPAFAG